MGESLRDRNERTFSRPGISPRPVGLRAWFFTPSANAQHACDRWNVSCAAVRYSDEQAMGYKLEIRADERYSQLRARRPIADFVASLPHIVQNGSHFALDDPPERWMEIYLSLVGEDGDIVGVDEFDFEGGGVMRSDSLDEPKDINCVSLHVSYGRFQPDRFAEDYLPTALAIAKNIGWPLIDRQTDVAVWSPT
jgi:hypothetical protein